MNQLTVNSANVLRRRLIRPTFNKNHLLNTTRTQSSHDSTVQHPMYIDGQFVSGRGDGWIDVLNPATGALLS